MSRIHCKARIAGGKVSGDGARAVTAVIVHQQDGKRAGVILRQQKGDSIRLSFLAS